jgi:phospholipid/cholesterol/gamma-HCH transport system substrate-binding protein
MRANYKVELASGIFLLLGIAALVWLATRATDYGQDIGKDTYSITARFQNVGDLRLRAPVKIGGVTVGLVESIELDPVSFQAVVTMAVASRFNEIPSDTGASVLTSGVLGDRYIGLEPGGAPDMLADGDELFITQSAIVLEQVVSKFLFNAGSGNEDQ